MNPNNNESKNNKSIEKNQTSIKYLLIILIILAVVIVAMMIKSNLGEKSKKEKLNNNKTTEEISTTENQSSQKKVGLLENITVYPAEKLPYVINDEEDEEYKNMGLERYHAYCELKEIRVREFTSEENEEFLKLMKGNTLNNLNKEYSLVEFYFGEIITLNKVGYDFITNKNTFFIYDDQIVADSYYGVWENDYNETLKLMIDDKEKIYGSYSNNVRKIIPIRTEYLKEGLQLKTKIKDQVVYFDIKK